MMRFLVLLFSVQIVGVNVVGVSILGVEHLLSTPVLYIVRRSFMVSGVYILPSSSRMGGSIAGIRFSQVR